MIPLHQVNTYILIDAWETALVCKRGTWIPGTKFKIFLCPGLIVIIIPPITTINLHITISNIIPGNKFIIFL